jgi:hypothetical protein
MNTNPEVVVLVGDVLTMNIVIIPLMAGLSYGLSVLMLNGLSVLDRWLDPSRIDANGAK